MALILTSFASGSPKLAANVGLRKIKLFSQHRPTLLWSLEVPMTGIPGSGTNQKSSAEIFTLFGTDSPVQEAEPERRLQEGEEEALSYPDGSWPFPHCKDETWRFPVPEILTFGLLLTPNTWEAFSHNIWSIPAIYIVHQRGKKQPNF